MVKFFFIIKYVIVCYAQQYWKDKNMLKEISRFLCFWEALYLFWKAKGDQKQMLCENWD